MFTINIAHEINQNAPILSEIIKRLDIKNNNMEIMLNLQYFLLEQNKHTDFLPLIATLLKIFYDADLLEEVFLIKWYEGQVINKTHFLYDEARNKTFIQQSAQFIKWLKEAAEEEDEEVE